MRLDLIEAAALAADVGQPKPETGLVAGVAVEASPSELLFSGMDRGVGGVPDSEQQDVAVQLGVADTSAVWLSSPS